jgi:tRNA 2-(methylsulfanyl)-N6-isopentenyladenosine37 hydroxylase
MRNEEPGRLVDVLIIGALIEARSCERFAALAPFVDEELGAITAFC